MEYTSTGKPILWAPQAGPQTALLLCPIEDVFFGGARGGGKCLPKSLRINTLRGASVAIGDVRTGDIIMAPNGSGQTVLAVHDQGVLAVYDFVLRDGRSARSSDDHLWCVVVNDSPPIIATTGGIRLWLELGYSVLLPCVPPVGGEMHWEPIASWLDAGCDDCVCIEVSGADKLFVLENGVCTHNSDGLLGSFLMHLQQNQGAARGLFFRKSYPELAEIWSRAMELYPATGAESNKTEMMFTWPNGAKIEFRYLENDDDAAKYQGRNVNFQAFDELGNFTSFDPIDKLYATLRSTQGVKCIRRSAGNPGGALTAGIKERYIDPAPPLTAFRWAPNKLRPDLTIESVYIPSRLDDNKLLLQNDPGYEARLAAAAPDPMLWKAWREGSWDGLFGRFFLNFDPNSDRCVVEPRPLSPWYTRWIAVDWGFAHDAAVTWGCYDGSVIYVYREFKARELTPAELCRIIVQMTGKDEQIDAVFLSPDASQRRSSPKTIDQEFRENLPWTVRRADNDRIGGWVLLNQMFQRGTLKLFSECKNLIKWLSTAQRDTKRPEDVLKHEGDDLGDSLRYLVKTSDIIPRTPPEVLYEQRILPHIQAGNGMKALIERYKLDEELRKGGKPISPRGKRRR